MDENKNMKKALPPTYFLGAIVLAVTMHFLLPLRQLLAFPWRLTGLAPLVIGILLNLLADHTFKKHETTVKPFEKSSSLVTGGVFGISRNPMYLGMTLVLRFPAQDVSDFDALIEREVAAVHRRFTDPEIHIFPAAVTILVPERDR